MQVFAYRAVNRDGQLIAAELASEGAGEARELIAQQGLTLIELRPRAIASESRTGGHESAETLIEFTRHMGNLLTAGIPILQILEDLETQAERKSWRRRLRDVRRRIEGGSTVSEALAAYPAAFSEIYTSLVQAGEESGQLPDVFRRLAAYLEWRRAVSQQVRQAVSYPLLVFGAMAGLIGILTFFVFPRLTEVFDALDVVLPLPTRVLLAVGQFGARGWPFALAAIPVIGVATVFFGRSETMRRVLDRWMLAFPVVSRVARLVIYARFSNSMATLLNSGVTLDRALSLSEKTVGNRVVAEAVRRTRDRVQGGATLAEALTNTGGFPHVLVRMVRVGETSGDLAGMLLNCNEFFEREIPQIIRKVLAACGPIMIVMLGSMVVWVALSIFLPLLQLGSAVK